MSMFVLPFTGLALPLAVLSLPDTCAEVRFVLSQEISLPGDKPISDAGDIRIRNSFNVTPSIVFTYNANGTMKEIAIPAGDKPVNVLARVVTAQDIGLSTKNITILTTMLDSIAALKAQLSPSTATPAAEVEEDFSTDDDGDVSNDGDDDVSEDDDDDMSDVSDDSTPGSAIAAGDIASKITAKQEKIDQFMARTAEQRRYFRSVVPEGKKTKAPTGASLQEDGKHYVFDKPMTTAELLTFVSGKLDDANGEYAEFSAKLAHAADETLNAFIAGIAG